MACYTHLGEWEPDSVYNACVNSTLLYSSDTWTTWVIQEKRYNSFCQHCLSNILKISWKDKVPYNEVLYCTDIPTMYSMLRQCGLHWLGHVYWMEEGCIPKTSHMVNSPLRRNQPDALNCASKTFVSTTWLNLLLTEHTGRKWQMTG